MGIENERLRLLPHDIEQTAEGSLLLIRRDGVEVELPTEFQSYYRWVQEGRTLAQIAKGLRGERQGFRFATLARYLIHMAENGLLVDRAAVRMAESMRSDHRWPESLAFEALLDEPILKMNQGPTTSVGRVLVPVLILAAGVMSAAAAIGGWRSGDLSDTESWTPLTWFLVFVMVFAFGRSARSIVQALLMRWAGGASAAIRLRVEPVSVHLGVSDLSTAQGGGLFLLGGVGASLLLASPSLVANWVPALQGARMPIALYVDLLLLAELSPFARSASTDLLRAAYNSFDRRRKPGGPSAGALESTFKAAHVSLSLVWCGCFAVFLVLPWFSWIRHLREQFDPSIQSHLVGTAFLVLSQGMILFSFFNDVLSAVRYGEGDDRRLVRRLWRRRATRLDVEDAILKGRVPSMKELEALPLLRQLDPQLRSELVRPSRVVSLGEGEAVCRQGDTDRALFIVLSGRLAVAKSSAGRKRKVVAFLETGAVFGEAAFFLGQTRTADVVCMEDSRVLEIPHDPNVQALDRARSEELQLRIWFLQALLSGSFLRELPSEALDALVFTGRKKSFAAGSHIVREGEDADACYFIVQGRATVVQNGKTINKLQNGDVFGEIALLNPGSPRTASVLAESDMITVVIEGERFWDLLSTHLPLAVEIERLSQRRLNADRERRP